MTVKSPKVRGGRGRLVGPDSRVLRSRDIERRAVNEQPITEQLIVSPFGAYGGDVTNNTGYAQELRIMLLPQLRTQFRPAYARLRVTTPYARNWVASAIYRYEEGGNSRGMLYKVGGTDSCFVTTTTGVKTNELQTAGAQPALSPSTRYFLGAYVSHSGIGVVTDANTSSRVISVSTVAMSSARKTTDSLSAQSLTKNFSKAIPWIVYLSKAGNQIL